MCANLEVLASTLNWNSYTVKKHSFEILSNLNELTKMVLEHQGLPNFQNAGLQPALQLYAAAAAHLNPRNRGAVAPWAPFLQFGMPSVFGSPFLSRPRFAPSTGSPPNQPSLVGLSGLGAIGSANGLNLGQHNLNGISRTAQGPPSECSNDEGGKSYFLSIDFNLNLKKKTFANVKGCQFHNKRIFAKSAQKKTQFQIGFNFKFDYLWWHYKCLCSPLAD